MLPTAENLNGSPVEGLRPKQKNASRTNGGCKIALVK